MFNPIHTEYIFEPIKVPGGTSWDLEQAAQAFNETLPKQKEGFLRVLNDTSGNPIITEDGTSPTGAFAAVHRLAHTIRGKQTINNKIMAQHISARDPIVLASPPPDHRPYHYPAYTETEDKFTSRRPVSHKTGHIFRPNRPLHL